MSIPTKKVQKKLKSDHSVFKKQENSKNSLNKQNSPAQEILNLHQSIGNRGVQRLFESGFIQGKLTVGKPDERGSQTASVARKFYNPSAIKSACLCSNCLFITFMKGIDRNMVFEFLFEVKVRSDAFFKLYDKNEELINVKIEKLDRVGKEWKVSRFKVVDRVIHPKSKSRRLLGTLKNCRRCETEIEKTSKERTYRHPKNGEMNFRELESFICAGAKSFIFGGGKAPSRCILLAADESEEKLKPVENRFSGSPVRVPVRFPMDEETSYLPEYVSLAPGTKLGPIKFLGKYSSGFVFKRWSEMMKLWLVLAYPTGQCSTIVGEIVAEYPDIAEKLRKLKVK